MSGNKFRSFQAISGLVLLLILLLSVSCGQNGGPTNCVDVTVNATIHQVNYNPTNGRLSFSLSHLNSYCKGVDDRQVSYEKITLDLRQQNVERLERVSDEDDQYVIDGRINDIFLGPFQSTSCPTCNLTIRTPDNKYRIEVSTDAGPIDQALRITVYQADEVKMVLNSGHRTSLVERQ